TPHPPSTLFPYTTLFRSMCTVSIFYRNPNSANARYVIAAIVAAAGIVSIHAHTICRATPQRTADSRLVAPTPMMAPVIVCVVLRSEEHTSELQSRGHLVC